MDIEHLQKLYLTYTGHTPESIEALSGSGSNRQYFRLKGTLCAIGVCGTSVEENRAFFYMAKHFREKGVPVPQIYLASEDESCYLQEDLGDTLLFNAIEQGRQTGIFSDKEKQLLRQSIRLLPKIQFEGAAGMDFNVCYPQPEFNRRSVSWDLNYFKYCFLKATGTVFQENLLEDDFERLAEVLLHDHTPTFMYRDFQSRNIMLKDGKPYFIDFQGGRKGPFYYDVASFLWQAKANLPDSLRKELAEEYLDALRPYFNISSDEFFRRLRHFVLFRTLQVLGTYGFRGYFEKKLHFIQSVPYALRNLSQLLEEGFEEYPYLCNVLTRLTKTKRPADPPEHQGLTVKVISFSYRKGIPEDESGNGGGYVFDCRAVHNPGKYDCYKPLTGLDEPVIRFLEKDGEITQFLKHADELADMHVKRYMERGFTHLSICFGCTGGRHRSVYSAQHVAEHINRKFGVKVHLIHREQNIEQTFDAR